MRACRILGLRVHRFFRIIVRDEGVGFWAVALRV